MNSTKVHFTPSLTPLQKPTSQTSEQKTIPSIPFNEQSKMKSLKLTSTNTRQFTMMVYQSYGTDLL